MVRETLALIAPAMRSAGLTLIADEIDGELPVIADRLRFRQVLLNLLSNAIKHNRAAGTVRLTSAVDGDVFRLTVADTGSGIQP